MGMTAVVELNHIYFSPGEYNPSDELELQSHIS